MSGALGRALFPAQFRSLGRALGQALCPALCPAQFRSLCRAQCRARYTTIGVTFLLSLLLVLITASAAMATAEPLPPRPPGVAPYTVVPIYDRYPVSAYSVDSDVHFSDSALKGQDLAINHLLLFKAWLIKLTIRVAEWALTGDLFAPAAEQAAAAMQGLATYTWQATGAPLVVAALAIAGFWAMLAGLAGRINRAFHLLGGTALVMVVAYALILVAPSALPALQKVARAASVQSVDAIASTARIGTAQELVKEGGAAAWKALVYEPWIDYQFTNRDAAVRYGSAEMPGSRLLNMRPSQRRQEYRTGFATEALRAATFEPWHEDFSLRRMLMAGWTALAAAAYAIPMLLLAGGIMAQQILLLAVLALLPLWLLAALWWSTGGTRLLQRILMTAAGALLMQVLLSVTLGVILLLHTIASVGLSTFGWAAQALLLATLAVVGYRYRLAWMGTAPSRRRSEERRERTQPVERSPAWLPAWISSRVEGERQAAAAPATAPTVLSASDVRIVNAERTSRHSESTTRLSLAHFGAEPNESVRVESSSSREVLISSIRRDFHQSMHTLRSNLGVASQMRESPRVTPVASNHRPELVQKLPRQRPRP